MIADVRIILELDAKPEIEDDEVRNLAEQAMAANFWAMRMEGIKVVDATVTSGHKKNNSNSIKKQTL